jgi:hypothetical protein
MEVASDVSIQRVVTRVLWDQQCFVTHMGVASDVNIHTVATRVQLDQLCFA